MSAYISGGGRAYGFDIEMIKSTTSTSSITSNSSSSILSESSNSPIAISTRKPRTPRKRPNQTYNEAAALLSTAYPKIFSTKHLTKPPSKFTKLNLKNSFFEPSPAELNLPFPLIDNTFSAMLLHQTILDKPNSRIELKSLNSSPSSSSCCEKFPVENEYRGNCCDDFDTESMLDEEIEEGIDSIMGNLSVENESINEANTTTNNSTNYSSRQINSCYGYPLGLGLGFNGRFDFGFGMRRGERCLRQVDEGDWWRFPSVEAPPPPPISKKVSVHKKKKKVEKLMELKSNTISPPPENSIPQATTKEEEEDLLPELKSNTTLLLKLNYDDVLNTWSDRGSPFPDDISGSGSESSGNDIHARLSQIDLFSEGGGVREASVLRYKEKRRTRLFSKKIRYQVRKVNADRRPRMKGRFVRRPSSPLSRQ